MYKRESRRPKVPISRRLESEGLTVGTKHNQEAKFKNSKEAFQAVSELAMEELAVQGQQTQSSKIITIFTAQCKKVKTS